MIKEFVPYRQALELYKLGFNEPCFGNYADDKNHTLFVNGNQPGETDAPTFSQAFRWFREKHNLHCEIGCAQNQFFFRIGKVDSFPHILDDNNRRYYNSCEEAELAALLKLIKVITNE